MGSEFARRLKSLRIEQNLSQEQLAEGISMTRSAVSNWENGHRVPSLPVLRSLALYLNISIDYLTGRSDKKSKIVANPVLKMDLSKLNSRGVGMLLEYYSFLLNDEKYRS